jgi:hypothetical protein
MIIKELNLENILKAYPVLKDFGLRSATLVDDELSTVSDYNLQIDLYGITDQMIIDAGLVNEERCLIEPDKKTIEDVTELFKGFIEENNNFEVVKNKITKHYQIKKYVEIINQFASAKSILERTGCEDIKEAIKSLREDGYMVSLVKR